MIVTRHGLSVINVLVLNEETGQAIITIREGAFQVMMQQEAIVDLIADGGMSEIRQAAQRCNGVLTYPDLKPKPKRQRRQR